MVIQRNDNGNDGLLIHLSVINDHVSDTIRMLNWLLKNFFIFIHMD